MYIAEPLSRNKIRHIAHQVKCLFGLQNTLYVPVEQVLERMHLVVPDAHFEIVEYDEMGAETHGVTSVTERCIKIRSDVYEGACNGCGRDRMTIAHELGHFFLFLLYGVSFCRTIEGASLPTYRNPEWQADCFGGEFLIDSSLVRGMSVNEVVEKCGVSSAAARCQLSKI